MKEVPANLRWACRRGMLELDVLLGNFLNEAYPKLPKAQQELFEHYLTNNDQDLFMWLTGKTPCTHPDFSTMTAMVRHHAENRHHS